MIDTVDLMFHVFIWTEKCKDNFESLEVNFYSLASQEERDAYRKLKEQYRDSPRTYKK